MILQEGIVDPAFKLLGLIAAGRSMATWEYADALDAINALMDMTSVRGLVFQITDETFSLTGPALYTIGPAGTWATVRPLRIRAAMGRASNGASRLVRIVDAEEYSTMFDGTATGLFAQVLTCDYAAPEATIRLNPAPVTGGTLELWSIKPLVNFATITDVLALPQGYLEFLKYNLAVALAPAFADAKLTQETAELAQSTMAALQTLAMETLGDPLVTQLKRQQQAQQPQGTNR
jgi:hypothetical protein